MYERSYGYKYEDASSGHAPDIAKMIRADIKQAISEGLLPKEATYSVRSQAYSGGQSIDITVKGWPFDRLSHERGSCSYGHMCPQRECVHPETASAKLTLERIHGAYNHDGSEIQSDYFDVRYYGGVIFEDAESAAWRAKEKAKKAARRAEMDEASATQEARRVLVSKADGSRVVHLAVEVGGRLRLLCGARPSPYRCWAAPEAASVSCSRCAKKRTNT